MAFSDNKDGLFYECDPLIMESFHRITIRLDGIKEYELVMDNGKRLEFNVDRFLELGLIREIKEEK